MSEEIKDTEAVENKEQEEKVTLGFLEKVASIFMKPEPQHIEAKAEEIEKEKAPDVEALVQEKLNELIPELKKKQSKELEEEKKALEQEKKELEEKQTIEILVDENYSEFVKFDAQKKGLTIEEYVEQNKQYAKSKAPVIDKTNENGEPNIVDAILQERKSKGFQ